jgi:hypothetical protein
MPEIKFHTHTEPQIKLSKYYGRKEDVMGGTHIIWREGSEMCAKFQTMPEVKRSFGQTRKGQQDEPEANRVVRCELDSFD